MALYQEFKDEGLVMVGVNLRESPEAVRIDRQGRVVGLVRGERDWQSEAARRLVRQLLSTAEGQGR